MTHIKRSALLPFSAERLFDLVNRVEHYPEFLPWCSKAEIISETDETMRARLTVGKGGFNQTFTTVNQLVLGERIDMRLEDGPFTELHGVWEFQALSDQACKITLDMTFHYSGALVRATLGPLFNHAANTMVEAFSKRAHEVYGA